MLTVEDVVESRWDVSRTTSCGLTELARTASLRNSLRRTREPYWIQNIRQQLTDQLKCLDVRLENHVAMLNELQDFYRRRSEVELEYSRGMDKLVRQITARHKTERQKRELWPSYSTHGVWQTLLDTTRKLGKDHGTLGELYGAQMSNRLVELTEDLQRVYKKCHEMAMGGHEELLKVLTELHSSMKTYQAYHTECQQAEAKMRHAESQRVKLERQQSTGGVTAAKTVLTRRFRNVEKQSEKKQAKYVESGLKAVKARNEYILCLEAANAALQKYFTDDLHDLINTMDFGYHKTLGRAVLMHISADTNVLKTRQNCLDMLNQQIRDVEQQTDKNAFLETFGHLFSQPRLFEFQAHRGDEVSVLSAETFLQDELFDRMNSMNERLNTLRLESEEIWKTLEIADNKLLEMTTQKDYDVTNYFRDDHQPSKSPQNEREKMRADRIETETFYLNKFRDYQTRSNLMVRLQSKYGCIEKALTGVSCPALNARPPNAPPKPKRRRAFGKSTAAVRPKLFGGTIQEYVEVTGEDIPLVIRSCVRVINLYGMHHQGVFRIPGSQNEINEFKNEFERGKDPLPDKVDGNDINSVAGVLKLYFRELKEPLFPGYIFNDLIACSNKCSFNTPESIVTSVGHIRALLSTLPKSIFVVMKYLFAFLNHLSEFSDENMMDPYNLAICFGPTLVRVPADQDPVQFHPHILELVRNVIIHQEDIFVMDDSALQGTTLYERCLIEDDGREDSIENLFEDDEIVGDGPSEEDVICDAKEAMAVYDFKARSDREISFHKGDVLLLFDKVSGDWWEGANSSNQRGLIPDKYIMLHNRDKTDVGSMRRRSTEEKFKSTESLPVVKTCHLSLHPSSDDDLSASHPNVSLGRTSRQSDTRPDTPGSAGLTGEEESTDDEVNVVVMVDQRKVCSRGSGTGSSSSAASSEELSPHQSHSNEQERPVKPERSKHRHRSLERSVSPQWDGDDSSLHDAAVEKKVHVEHMRLLEMRKSPETRKSPEPRCESPRVKRLSSGSDVAQRDAHDFREDDHKTTEDLALDIDSALAEVMTEIERLGLSCMVSTKTDHAGSTVVQREKSPLESVFMHDNKGTPDLVIGLPVAGLPPPSPKGVVSDKQHVPSSPKSVTPDNHDISSQSPAHSIKSPSRTLTTAEVFANSSQCTIKKGSGVGSSTLSADRSSSGIHAPAARTTMSVDIQPEAPRRLSKPVPAVRTKSVDEVVLPPCTADTRPPTSPQLHPAPKPMPRSDVPRRIVPSAVEMQPDGEFVRSLGPAFKDPSSSRTSDREPPACAPTSQPSRSSLVISAGIATLPRTSASERQDTSSHPPAKPPTKVKPPVMKKPAKAGEMIKRLQESAGSSNAVCHTVVGVTTSTSSQ